jgi:hypothetical protein
MFSLFFLLQRNLDGIKTTLNASSIPRLFEIELNSVMPQAMRGTAHYLYSILGKNYEESVTAKKYLNIDDHTQKTEKLTNRSYSLHKRKTKAALNVSLIIKSEFSAA